MTRWFGRTTKAYPMTRVSKQHSTPKRARAFAVGTLPTREAVLEAMAQHPDLDGKRDLAKHFGIHGDMQTPFKVLLKEMEGDGLHRPHPQDPAPHRNAAGRHRARYSRRRRPRQPARLPGHLERRRRRKAARSRAAAAGCPGRAGPRRPHPRPHRCRRRRDAGLYRPGHEDPRQAAPRPDRHRPHATTTARGWCPSIASRRKCGSTCGDLGSAGDGDLVEVEVKLTGRLMIPQGASVIAVDRQSELARARSA